MAEVFIRQLAMAGKALREIGAVVLDRHGVYLGQDLVLDALGEQDGLTPGELAARLTVSGPTVVKMAQRMEAHGLVTRRRDDRDGRLVRVYLTDHGRSLREPIARDLRRLDERATAGLSATEQKELSRALELVARNLQALAAEGRGSTPGPEPSPVPGPEPGPGPG